MNSPPRTASVVIPSYNYGRYLRNAIDSAMTQVPPPLEVIVVDDGSTDESAAVLESYGPAIRFVSKENGGHASAINVGCELAQGDVVFLLDSDDEMRPGTIETVLSAWRPGTVLVHWRPSQMDAEGHDITGTVPAPWIQLEEGDLRERILATGSFETTVTSGLALRRDALEEVLPIPELFRQGADGYLVRAMAFQGNVQAIDRPLTRYRRHGRNDSDFGASYESVAAGLRRRIEFKTNELGVVPELARAHGMQVDPHYGDYDPDYMFVRLASLKLEPQNHPIQADSLRRLFRALLRAQWHARRSLRVRLAGIAFATLIVLLPRELGWKLLAWRHTPAARPGWLASLTALRHRSVAR